MKAEQERERKPEMKRIVLFLRWVLLLGILTLTMAEPEWVRAASAQEIRVGLTELYSGKESITIQNTELSVGYCVDRKFLSETVLQSPDGFVFTPVTGYFIDSGVIYASAAAAKTQADSFCAAGRTALPVCTYRNRWHVYFDAGTSYAELEELLTRVRLFCPQARALTGNNYRVLCRGGFGTLLIDIDDQNAYPQFFTTGGEKPEETCLNLGTRKYRGRIEIGRYGKTGLTAVNIVPLEEYLYGVVPAEMNSGWHMEALKAQAVCSRSYAMVKAGLGGDSDAGRSSRITDTVSSQVYRGYLAETERTNAAVDATRGETVCYENRVIAAYFFSTSGGQTESAEDVWSVALPYLTGVPDPFETAPERKPWVVTMSLSELSELLTKRGTGIGAIRRLTVTGRTTTGRASALNFVGDSGNLTLQGSTIRTVLGLYSTRFQIVKSKEVPDRVTVRGSDGTRQLQLGNAYVCSASGTQKASDTLEQYIVKGAQGLLNYPRTAPTEDSQVMFAGMGYGHGVGMSQSGARGMAEAGNTYRQIISYYYTGARVQ